MGRQLWDFLPIEKEKCLPQLVLTVKMNAKYHSNQKMTDLFIVENASKIINQNQEVMVDQEVDQEVMVETEVLVMVETEVLVMVEETIDHEKCLMQNAEIVEMIAKYHSNQKKTDLFIAMNASKNIETISKLF
jgi:hypothetical protein